MQRAAFEILLTRGGTDQDIEAVRTAATQEDETALRDKVSTLFAQHREPSGLVPPAKYE